MNYCKNRSSDTDTLSIDSYVSIHRGIHVSDATLVRRTRVQARLSRVSQISAAAACCPGSSDARRPLIDERMIDGRASGSRCVRRVPRRVGNARRVRTGPVRRLALGMGIGGASQAAAAHAPRANCRRAPISACAQGPGEGRSARWPREVGSRRRRPRIGSLPSSFLPSVLPLLEAGPIYCEPMLAWCF